MQQAEIVFDWQGHRGARGLLPENTIPAFEKALEFSKITTLEADLVISKDNQVVVSHEPWFSHLICLQPNGQAIPESTEARYRLLDMTYDSIARFDCGSLVHPRFSQQLAFPNATKPLLVDMVRAADAYAHKIERPLPEYNLEIKSDPEWDNVLTPVPEVFAEIVLKTLDSLQIKDRCTLQSFDVRSLQAIRERAPDVRLALLVEHLSSLEQSLAELGFTPNIFSPNHLLLSHNLVEKAHQLGMRVIPWTVNETERMQALIDIGVDGIITDYPDRIPKN